MKIRLCESLILPYDFAAPSSTEANVTHHAVPRTLLNDAFCSCKGFQHNGKCWHVTLVEEARCTWMDTREDQKAVFNNPILVCPNCGREVVTYDLEPEIN